MGVFDWSRLPAQNGEVDPAVPARDGASARTLPASVRGVMAGTRQALDALGGALRTTGDENLYEVAGAGITELRPGLALLVAVHRTNTDDAFLSVDGLGPRPWREIDGGPAGAGSLPEGRYCLTVYDAPSESWRVISGSQLSAARGHTLVADRDYQVLATDVQVGVRPLTASRRIFLPDVDIYPLGQDLVIADEAGSCSETITITILPGPGTGDAILGWAGGVTLASPGASARFRRGAADVWILA